MREEILSKHFSELMQKTLSTALSKKQKIALIVNKKGYASGIICQKCGHIPHCKNCDVPIAYHQLPHGEMIGLCHICKTQYPEIHHCSKCQSNEIQSYGMGIQQVAKRIEETYRTTPLIIDTTSTNSETKLTKLDQQFKDHQIFLGTSLLSTPPAGLVFDYVIVVNADTGLNIPDYNSQLRNFEFLREILTHHQNSNFIIQTFNPEAPSILAACKMSLESFEQTDMTYKKLHNYPPFSEVCVLLYKNEIEEKLFNQTNKLYQELLFLKEKYQVDCDIYATPPLIYKIFGKYRYNIIIKGKDVRNFMDIIFSKLKILSRGFKVDWDAKNLI